MLVIPTTCHAAYGQVGFFLCSCALSDAELNALSITAGTEMGHIGNQRLHNG